MYKKNTKISLETILLAKEGDKNSMEAIINLFTGFVYREAKRTFIKNFDVDDLVQMGYIGIINAVNSLSIEKLTPFKEEVFKGYIFKCIKNVFYMEIRKIAKTNFEASLDSNPNEDNSMCLLDTLCSDFLIEDYILELDERKMLIDALNHLSLEDRELIEAFYLKNIPLIDYATAKNTNYTTFLKRRQRAIEKLRKYLKKEA